MVRPRNEGAGSANVEKDWCTLRKIAGLAAAKGKIVDGGEADLVRTEPTEE